MPVVPAFFAVLVIQPALARGPCGTLSLREERKHSADASGRPDSVGYVDSVIYPIRVHYRREEDADRAATVVLPAAELAWQVEVDQMGWLEPTVDAEIGGDTDRFDYYLTNEETAGGGWTWGPYRDVYADDDYYSIAAFVALDDRYITDRDMPDFVVHEFNHALQYRIDGVEATSFVWESTAQAMEELVLPDSNLYAIDIADFNDLPFASLLFDGYSDEITAYNDYSLYEYGGNIAGLYLEQAYGNNDGTTLLQLWLDLAQGGDRTSPDYIDALALAGGNAAPTYEDVYLGLAEWRMFVADDDDGAHYLEAADWPRAARVAREPDLALSGAEAGVSVTPVDAPYDLGTSYFDVTLDADLTLPLHVAVDGDDASQWGVVAAAWQDGAAARVVKTRAEAGAPLEVDLDLTGATQVRIGVANLGAPNLAAGGRHPRRDFTLTLTRTSDVSGEDSGDTSAEDHPDSPAPETKAGCGCATGSDPLGAPLGAPLTGTSLLAVAALTMLRRRNTHPS